MNVLHITYSDSRGAGGTSIATERLHRLILGTGHGSRILCCDKALPDTESAQIPRSRLLERGLREILGRAGLNDLHALSSFFIPRHPWFREADLIHFHSLHSGYFNYLALPRLTREKPALWTVHDLWAFTGHCSFPYACERWETGCGKCPSLNTYPPVKRDATALEWRLKRRAYSKSRLTVVVTSRWQEAIARRSILGGFPIERIPYGVDTTRFHPGDTHSARTELELPAGKKILLFLSGGRVMDPRKGAKQLIEAIGLLPESLRRETVVVATGMRREGDPADFGVETHFVGNIPHDLMTLLFHSADVFVFPTRAETFGIVALESMACGVPVLAAAVGGVLDHVRHEQTGLVYDPARASNLTAALERLLTDDALRRRLGAEGRRVAVEEYDDAVQWQKYSGVYRRVLEGRSKV